MLNMSVHCEPRITVQSLLSLTSGPLLIICWLVMNLYLRHDTTVFFHPQIWTHVMIFLDSINIHRAVPVLSSQSSAFIQRALSVSVLTSPSTSCLWKKSGSLLQILTLSQVHIPSCLVFSFDYWNISQLHNFFFFWDRVSLCSPGCPGTHSLNQAGLGLRNPPASASQVLRLESLVYELSVILSWEPYLWKTMWCETAMVDQ